MDKKKGAFARMKEQFRENPGTWALYGILRLIVILVAVRCAFAHRWEQLFLCVVVLILFVLPSILARRLKIELPSTMERIIMLFVFASEILGEIGGYYQVFPWWDTMLHTLWGFLCAAIGFSLVDLLNRDPNIKFSLSPIFCALVAVCFSMTVGVLWEFFEFAMDRLFAFDMQKDTIVTSFSSVVLGGDGTRPFNLPEITSSTINGVDYGLPGYLDIGLFDTMSDLLVNFIGAVVFSVFGYQYIKYQDRKTFAQNLIPRMADPDEPEQTPES
ncbi:MAG: hypothetical protein Q4D06_04580 [Coriobacteriia bacterium]|nr:hypothetical protein [Coriobacteriia bacterium]